MASCWGDEELSLCAAKENIDREFNIKEWKNLMGRLRAYYLGEQVTQKEDYEIFVHMQTYADKLEALPVKCGADKSWVLNPEEKAAARRLAMKLCWPESPAADKL